MEQTTPQRQPSQDDLRSHTREFGGEASRLDTVTAHADRLADALNRLIPIIDRIDRSNGNGNHAQSEQHWPYAGIDTARDHKMLGGVITQLERSMMQLESSVMLIEPAIARLEARIVRVEIALNRLHQAV